MNKVYKSWLGLGLSSAALATSHVAIAQVEEIVVTAQRRSENIQNVPITVSAVTADTLETLGAVSVADLSATAPGLHVSRQLASPLIYIRGIGTANTQGGQEGSTAVYVDGIYYAELPGLNFSFNNIERIEVLKGPQGTLFGRNATGGLVHIITKDPAKDPSLQLSLSEGNYDTHAGKLYATGGFGDSVAADIAFVGSSQDEGFGRNVITGNRTGYTEEYGARSTWLVTPSEDTSIRASFDFSTVETTQGLARQAAPGARTVDGQGPLPDYFDIHSNLDPYQETDAYGVGLKITHSFDQFDLVSLTGYRNSDTDLVLDQDSTAIPLVNAPIFYETRTLSQELQIVSTKNDRFQWIAGLFYFDADFDYQLVLNGAAFAALGGVDDKRSVQPTTSYAGFAQTTVALGDASHITVGGRYTRDKRELRGSDAFGNGLVVPASAPSSTTFSQATWRLAYDYRFSEQLLAFASYNRGFKGGLYNMVNLAQEAVEPETVDAYEVGFKSDLLGRRLRLNGSAFFYKYQDLQVQVINAGITVLQNAAEAEVKGVELELQAAPTERLNIFAGLAYLDTEYTDFPGAQLTVPNPAPFGGNAVSTGSAAGNELVRAPDLSGSLAINYEIPSSIGTWGLSGSYVYTGTFFWEPDNRREQEAIGLTNAELSWKDQSEKFRVFAFGRNLSDEHYSQFVSGGGLGDTDAAGTPRMYGIGVEVTFK